MSFVFIPLNPDPRGWGPERDVIVFSNTEQIRVGEIALYKNARHHYWWALKAEGAAADATFPEWGLVLRHYYSAEKALKAAEEFCGRRGIKFSLSEKAKKVIAEEKTFLGKVKRFFRI